MKIALLTLFVSSLVALAAPYPVSVSTTNGRAFGTTDISSLVGKIITGNVTNAAGSRVAYLSDTNGLGGGSGTTYTNNTDIAALITGSGIGSNLTAYARLDAPTNNFEFDAGVNGTFGTATATADTLFVAGTIRGVYTNLQARWDHEGFLRGTNITVADNFFSPTNAAVVGQVLHATSTGGATKWDYVNQVLTNSNPVVPDFTLPVNYWVTNAAFLFLAPAGVETTGKKLQVTDVIVTNSTAAAVAVTFPGSIRVTGTAFITNLSVFHFRQFAGKWTNVVCEPVW